MRELAEVKMSEFSARPILGLGRSFYRALAWCSVVSASCFGSGSWCSHSPCSRRELGEAGAR